MLYKKTIVDKLLINCG